MAKYKVEACAWFSVEIEDDGENALADQAHDAAMDFVGVPYGRLDDLEIHAITETTAYGTQ